MQLSKNEIIAVHDVAYDATGKSYDEETLLEMLKQLPEPIVNLGVVWGFTDTEFREAAYEFWSK